jgi:hypothetical protein
MPYRIIHFLFVVVFLPGYLFGQPLSDDSAREAAKNLKLTAAKMLKAYTSRDFEASAAFVHPSAVEIYFGSRARLVEALKLTTHKMDSQNYIMVGGAIHGISKIVRANTELQAVVTQSVRARIPNGSMNSITSLLAISSDSGKTWYFVGIGNKKRQDLENTGACETDDHSGLKRSTPLRSINGLNFSSLSSLCNMPASSAILSTSRGPGREKYCEPSAIQISFGI